MKKTLLYFTEVFTLITSLLFFISCSYASDNTLNIKKNINRSLQYNKPVTSKLKISKNLSIPVTYNATKKGNGTIDLNGLLIRVFDQHDDGIVYKNNFLNVEIKDLNDDGYNEIIFTGTLKFTGEKETDPVSYKTIKRIYELDCPTGMITSRTQNNSYPIELRNVQKSPIKCNN